MNVLEMKQDIDFEKYLDDYESRTEGERCKPISTFSDKAWEILNGNVEHSGDRLPWRKTFEKFQFRAGELTIWAGVNGSGKSLVMGQAAIWLEKPVVIASMEMLPESTTARIMRQSTGTRAPTREYYDQTMAQLHGRVYLYDHTGDVTNKSMLGLCHYAAQEIGAGHVIVDSLVKCGLGVDDYNGQKRFVNQLKQAAHDHGIHVHLVVHVRKGQKEHDMPDKFDIKGAGEITDLADNVLIVSRARVPEGGKPASDDSPDGFIRVAKQRNGEWEGTWGFWYHEDSLQWIPRYNAGAMPWPEAGD